MLHIIQYQPFFTVVKTFQLIYYLSLSGIQCTKKNSKCLHVGTIPFVSYCSSALLQTDVKITSNRSKPLRDFTWLDFWKILTYFTAAECSYWTLFLWWQHLTFHSSAVHLIKQALESVIKLNHRSSTRWRLFCSVCMFVSVWHVSKHLWLNQIVPFCSANNLGAGEFILSCDSHTQYSPKILNKEVQPSILFCDSVKNQIKRRLFSGQIKMVCSDCLIAG